MMPSYFFPRLSAIFNMGLSFKDDLGGGFEKGPWWKRLLNVHDITTAMVVLNSGWINRVACFMVGGR